MTVTPAQLSEVLLDVAVVRPGFLWGAPGIGKSSMVRQFAASLGLDCVSLIGTQLAPEDLIGVPQIVAGRSRFCPHMTAAKLADVVGEHVVQELGDSRQLHVLVVKEPERHQQVAGLLHPADPVHHQPRDIPDLYRSKSCSAWS